MIWDGYWIPCQEQGKTALNSAHPHLPLSVGGTRPPTHPPTLTHTPNPPSSTHPTLPLRPTGTLLTAELALEHGLACNTAGGTHHAFSAHGSGFCILNDLAVAAEALLAQGRVQRVLILDLDVHQASAWQGFEKKWSCVRGPCSAALT